MSTSWHSYPSIFAMGHRALANLFDGEVLIEEKVDGSQFSFGRFDGDLKARSKGKELVLDNPEKMFARGVEVAEGLDIHDGWTYRGEYLEKPKHNALAYSRIPAGNVIIFDINDAEESYLPYEAKAEEAARLGLEVVPRLSVEPTLEGIVSALSQQSILGGQLIEGVVVKNYAQFGMDKKVLMGKYVSEAFKEVHKGSWREQNPSKTDIITGIIAKYRTPARFDKAVIHLSEAGVLDNSPRDIGSLMKAVGEDVLKECEDEIKEALWKYAWPQIQRGVTGGLPEWYKQKLLADQFVEV